MFNAHNYGFVMKHNLFNKMNNVKNIFSELKAWYITFYIVLNVSIQIFFPFFRWIWRILCTLSIFKNTKNHIHAKGKLTDELICLLVISLKITSIKKSNNSWAILKNTVLKSKPTRSSSNYIADCITCTENLILLTSCSNLFCESILRSEYYLISELHMLLLHP